MKSGNRDKLIQEKTLIHVNDLVKTFDITVIFAFKKKCHVSFICHRRLEGSKLPYSLKTDDGDQFIVVYILKYLR